MAEPQAAWVWVGAGAMACVAGIVNVVGFLGFEHQAITHLTVNSSLLVQRWSSAPCTQPASCSARLAPLSAARC